MRTIQIKICGMKDPSNIEKVVILKPEYMGFILYKGSPRYISLKRAGKLVKNIPASIRKVGVLVNESPEDALMIAKSGVFDLIQLHGDESADYCRDLSLHCGIIKAFPISGTLPRNLEGYRPYCSMFLFDTAGTKHGGTGKMFRHRLLRKYTLQKEYILSGGISPFDAAYVRSIHDDKMICVDLNSRFEVRPGIKNIDLLKTFIDKIRNHDDND